jgi:methionyl aminopeptidase
MASGPIIPKSLAELQIIEANGDLLGRTHAEVAKHIKPGVRTLDLDKIAYEYILDHGAKPSFKGLYGCPSTLLTSVNEAVVHGLPNETILRDGDIISVDCGVFKDGYHADSAYTYAVGNVSHQVKALLQATYQSLHEGIARVRAGNRVGDVSNAVQTYVEARGYSVVRELVGHGLGVMLHEAPEVPNYGQRGKGPLLVEGMVIAIEPMINLGKRNVVTEKDNWTVRTVDRKPSAHFEHTVALYEGKPWILTTFKYIEEVLKSEYGQAVIH